MFYRIGAVVLTQARQTPRGAWGRGEGGKREAGGGDGEGSELTSADTPVVWMAAVIHGGIVAADTAHFPGLA